MGSCCEAVGLAAAVRAVCLEECPARAVARAGEATATAGEAAPAAEERAAGRAAAREIGRAHV